MVAGPVFAPKYMVLPLLHKNHPKDPKDPKDPTACKQHKSNQNEFKFVLSDSQAICTPDFISVSRKSYVPQIQQYFFMSEADICAFCLGGNTEIPPFGSIRDAEDLVKPCSTCSLVAHRKCLLDWFNSLPASKLIRTYGDDAALLTTRPTNENSEANNEAANENENENGNQNQNQNANENEIVANEVNEENIVNIALWTLWGSALNWNEDSEPESLEAVTVLLSTSCPQCKNKITFRMKRLPFLALNNVLRSSLAVAVQYSGVFLGLSGAATGIVTLGYVGLARCGINMLDVVVPSSVLLPLLTRQPRLSLNWLPFSTPDKALGMDQLKFQHVPLLPVMLYRMRYLLILSCVFNSTAKTGVANWVGEFLVCNYISSLGNHTLVKLVYRNTREILAGVLRNPRSITAVGIGLFVKNIDWLDPAVMVGSMLPLRWVYDILFRLTINRRHLDLTTAIRPRDVANTLSEAQLSRLEELDNQLGRLHFEFRARTKRATQKPKGTYSRLFHHIRTKLRLASLLLSDDFVLTYAKLKLMTWYYKSKACLQNDYSTTLLYQLAVITCVTTVLWPFLGSDLGKLVFLIILRAEAFDGVSKDRLVFLSNLVGMAGVAVIKDFFNLYLSAQKARQLSDLSVVYHAATSPRPPATPSSQFPGAYVQ